MIAPKSGHCADSVTTPLRKHGMAEHSSVLITQSAPPSLSGSGIPSGSKKCGKVDLIEWLPI